NVFDLLNISAVNIIFAVGLLLVLISGGIDISFAVAASIVQYVTALALERIGGGGWVSGFDAAIGLQRPGESQAGDVGGEGDRKVEAAGEDRH
ncbi:hypothetical protein ACC811_36560, partial [Rhizobium ruizarguesonis]